VPASGFDTSAYTRAVTLLELDVGGTFTHAVRVDEGRVSIAEVPTAAQQEQSMLQVDGG
jgi:N-methylhydantoinase A/oxoprolinase/acetone carboxylase beta subunit